MVMFDLWWELGAFKEGVQAYVDAGRPFWQAGQVAAYYESRGMFAEALVEWRHLVDSYFEMGERLFPFIDNPQEVFLVGAWLASTDPARAITYLTEYARVSEQWGGCPGFCLPYGDEARKILDRLSKGGSL